MKLRTKRNRKKSSLKAKSRKIQRGGVLENIVELINFPRKIQNLLLPSPMIKDYTAWLTGGTPTIALWFSAQDPLGNGSLYQNDTFINYWYDLSRYRRHAFQVLTGTEFGPAYNMEGTITGNTITINKLPLNGNQNELYINGPKLNRVGYIQIKDNNNTNGFQSGTSITGQISIAEAANGIPGREGVYSLNKTYTTSVTSTSFQPDKVYTSTVVSGKYNYDQPKFLTSGINGLPALYMPRNGGSKCGMIVPAFPKCANFTIFIVTKLDYNSDTENYGSLFIHTNPILGHDIASCIHLRMYTQNLYFRNEANNIGIKYPTEPCIITINCKADKSYTMRILTNKSADYTTYSSSLNTPLDTNSGNPSPFFIGTSAQFYKSEVPESMNGYIGELIYMQGIVPTDYIDLTEAFLAKKWNFGNGAVDMGLPSNHPYRPGIGEMNQASAATASAAYASEQIASGQIASGQIASAAYASGQIASGQIASAAYASGQIASGQMFSAAYASGQEASGQYASGQQASAAYASGQQASGQQYSAAYASGQQASGQQYSGAYASGQQASAAYASGQRASAATASGQIASAAYAYQQQNSAAYAADQIASAAVASGQMVSAAYASGQKASGQQASGQQYSAAYAPEYCCPEACCPEAYAPEYCCPEACCPDAYAPEYCCPEACCPEA